MGNKMPSSSYSFDFNSKSKNLVTFKNLWSIKKLGKFKKQLSVFKSSESNILKDHIHKAFDWHIKPNKTRKILINDFSNLK